jgi:rod shape-determining protein MreC
MTGDASSTPKLEYLRGADPIKAGDRILTSGDGGMIPRGLPVGTAVKGLDGAWRVRLDADEIGIDFVRILLFKDFSQLVNLQELAQPAPPPPHVAAQPQAQAQPQAVTVGAPAAPKPAAAAAAPKAVAAPSSTAPAKPAAAKAIPPASAPAASSAAPADSGA